MDGCVLLTSTPSCVVSPRGDPSGCALGIARRGETTYSGVDVNNTHPSMINPLNHAIYTRHISAFYVTIVGQLDIEMYINLHLSRYVGQRPVRRYSLIIM